MQAIINNQYERAREILSQYQSGHHALAELLQQREVIYTEDAERIFGPRQWKSRTEEIIKEESANRAAEAAEAAGDNITVTPPPFEQSDNQ